MPNTQTVSLVKCAIGTAFGPLLRFNAVGSCARVKRQLGARSFEEAFSQKSADESSFCTATCFLNRRERSGNDRPWRVSADINEKSAR